MTTFTSTVESEDDLQELLDRIESEVRGAAVINVPEVSVEVGFDD